MTKTITISIISRLHDSSYFRLLEKALDSCQMPAQHKLKHVVVTQNLAQKQVSEFYRSLSERYPNRDIEIVNVEGDGDIRSKLLNEGIKRAQGQGLGFLDYDDEYAPTGLTDLVNAFETLSHKDAIIAGRVDLRWIDKNENVIKEESPYVWGEDHFDLVLGNFLPIHSYLINLDSIDKEALRFSEDFTLLEDYEFLVRTTSTQKLRVRFLKDILVGYHHLRIDGSNSSVVLDSESEKIRQWHQAEDTLRRTFQALDWHLSYDELYSLAETRNRSRRYLPYAGQAFLELIIGLYRTSKRPNSSGIKKYIAMTIIAPLNAFALCLLKTKIAFSSLRTKKLSKT